VLVRFLFHTLAGQTTERKSTMEMRPNKIEDLLLRLHSHFPSMLTRN
jgi:hypothetical protein